MLKNTEKTMDKIVALCKGRGFIFPGSEIYGGLANTWDYGPLGVEFKNNVKKAWWKKFVQENPYNVGLDAAILMNPQVWVASGHVATFNDPLIDCKACRTRHRADKLVEEWNRVNGITDVVVEAMDNDALMAYIREKGIECPECGKKEFTDIRKFNLMFKTFQSVTEDSASTVYLRPETAQGIFVQFKNIQRTTRRKLPFGVCQVGKSFRNEITPGNFTFRTREFEQMELEFFCRPGTDLEWFSYWREYCHKWLLGLGMRDENIRLRDHEKEELSHYSNATTDFEFMFPFGEPSLGADRVALAFLIDAYDEEVVDAEKNDTRVVLHLHPALAPFKCAVMPLSKKLSEPATELFHSLQKYFMVDYDEAGSIGKRYRRQDDFDSAEDVCVPVRDRDTMQQERVPMADLVHYLLEKTDF